MNNDVSCRYFVSRDGAYLIAELSLVGPYAVVLDPEVEKGGPIMPGMPVSDLARDLLETLVAHGLQVLDEGILCLPLDMTFQNVAAGQGTLYQALISDTPGPFGGHVQRGRDSAT